MRVWRFIVRESSRTSGPSDTKRMQASVEALRTREMQVLMPIDRSNVG